MSVSQIHKQVKKIQDMSRSGLRTNLKQCIICIAVFYTNGIISMPDSNGRIFHQCPGLNAVDFVVFGTAFNPGHIRRFLKSVFLGCLFVLLGWTPAYLASSNPRSNESISHCHEAWWNKCTSIDRSVNQYTGTSSLFNICQTVTNVQPYSTCM